MKPVTLHGLGIQSSPSENLAVAPWCLRTDPVETLPTREFPSMDGAEIGHLWKIRRRSVVAFAQFVDQLPGITTGSTTGQAGCRAQDPHACADRRGRGRPHCGPDTHGCRTEYPRGSDQTPTNPDGIPTESTWVSRPHRCFLWRTPRRVRRCGRGRHFRGPSASLEVESDASDGETRQLSGDRHVDTNCGPALSAAMTEFVHCEEALPTQVASDCPASGRRSSQVRIGER